ncbi:hypothetical protein WJ0W_004568 [Paenibacillus melissococcoides]|uniref:Uncharacterized protein n=1 Tax=Paenibacillus melissococcoides TaxID=2912268 RepID=A0ABM9G7Y8_9BACL|nr:MULTISPECIES: hypothetical protein [Paenibacillus]MEB9895082.1 hypothetical protein [Bacillus cereus]CAH8247334.1 hypothetical protein WJ0W_004568 [Paenibacillus melissococcoides]CAH8717402.1 hypothetical protein HTL2_004935 [Paenibacillus melissococcoides]CAH8718389.1 hypothetical protein WDD9_005207 [Paenibacillus melissococcoides]GIO77866.1 hypothetical protein J6TS7_14760 [Paenibacillus dendritiformis]
MGKQKGERIQLKVVAHYVLVDGDKRVEVDPATTNLPDRCKLALAEMITGQKYELTEMSVGS